jgi:hypothetical protein
MTRDTEKSRLMKEICNKYHQWGPIGVGGRHSAMSPRFQALTVVCHPKQEAQRDEEAGGGKK